LFDENPKMLKEFEEEKIKLDIAEHVYYLRDATGLTQEEFGELVGIDPVIIDDLEESDYEGDSLAGLAHIEKALRRHVEAPIKPAEDVYPNALLTATITGLKLRLFRYHIGRKSTPVNNEGFGTHLNQDKHYILNELEPWQEALQRNKQELRMFALAGVTEWCHLDGRLRGNFSGNPNEYIQAASIHNQLIGALEHCIQTDERTVLKQWRQNIGEHGEARYINELEAAFQQKIFEEFPDTEWLVQTLLEFLKTSVL
jgi:DNA-binding protein HU-beta